MTTPNPIAAWLAANAAEPRYGAARYAIRPVTGAGYFALMDGDQEMSDSDAVARLNEQEKTIAELRLALDDAHQHVGAFIAAYEYEQVAVDQYEATRGTEDWERAGIELEQAGIATARRLSAARAWLRRRG